MLLLDPLHIGRHRNFVHRAGSMRGGKNDSPCLEGCLTHIHSIAELLVYGPLQLQDGKKYKNKRYGAIGVHFERFEPTDSLTDHWLYPFDELLTYSFIHKMNMRLPPYPTSVHIVFLENNQLQSL